MKFDMQTRSPPADLSPWLPFESRRRARDEKREAVLRAATRLFLERGYHRATLDEVATRLNITKPALYNYFRGKEEILFACWSTGREHIEAIIGTIEAEGGTGLAKLRKFIRGYGALMATDYGALVIRFDVQDLTDANAKVARAGNRRVDQAFRSYIAEGLADGSIRPCDVKLSAFAIAGALNWIGHWYRRGGDLTPEAVAAEFAVRLTDGLEQKPLRKRQQAALARKRLARGGSQ
jgi:AcrR family transcriptional regulator